MSISGTSQVSKLSVLGSKSQRDYSPSLSRSAAGALNAAVAELAADLNSPEISFDLQQFIASEIAVQQASAAGLSVTSSQAAQAAAVALGLTGAEDSLFTDLLESKSSRPIISQQFGGTSSGASSTNSGGNSSGNSPVCNTFQMPHTSAVRYNSSGESVKREPLDPHHHNNQHMDLKQISDNSFIQSQGSSSSSFASGYGSGLSHIRSDNHNVSHYNSSNPSSSGRMGSGGKSKSSKKSADKGSDEYKKRRERNNVAVRKSREKAKVRSRETEKKVSELHRDNDTLRKRVDLLGSQLQVLKTLLSNVGVPPESVESEIARSLHMESHNPCRL